MATAAHAQQLAAHVVSQLFHYRADVLLRLSDPLHLREVRDGRGPTQSVLVLYLPDRLENTEQVSGRNKGRSSEGSNSQQKTPKPELNHTFFFVCPEK